MLEAILSRNRDKVSRVRNWGHESRLDREDQIFHRFSKLVGESW
jgi:hypothetical protein